MMCDMGIASCEVGALRVSGPRPTRNCGVREKSVGCFWSSEGFSQVTPRWRERTRLILLLFGGIPNSPCLKMSF
jgi:hypothetical protein